MHPTKILTYKGRKVKIDCEIVPLLQKMWTLGIGTWNSCQAHCSFACKHKVKIDKTKEGCAAYSPIKTKDCDNYIWLVFDSCRDLEKLYDLVAEYDIEWMQDKDCMYNNMRCQRDLAASIRYKQHKKDNWYCIFPIFNHGVKRQLERPTINGKRTGYQLWVEKGCKKNNFIIEPQLTFPREHLAYVEKRLDLAIAKLKKKDKI